MTMELTCPDCGGALELRSGMAHCGACQRDFSVIARCPGCQQPLEVLKACGAVDYFCQHGHGLISKKRALFSFA